MADFTLHTFLCHCRSRREPRLPSSTSVCAPAPANLSTEAIRNLERIYTDSSDAEESGPRRWGAWQGATLATEAACPEAGASVQRDHILRPSFEELYFEDDAAKDDHESDSDYIELPAARAFADRAERPGKGAGATRDPEQSTTSATFMSRLRKKRRSVWGKFRMSSSSAPGEDIANASQLMSEEDAWAVIQKWRCIVDAHFDDSVHAAVSKFAELADELDVAAMDPAEQRRTVQATGFPLPEILETQGQRQLAMISLMHIHSRLVFKVTRSSLRCPACDTVLLPWDLPQPAPSTTPV